MSPALFTSNHNRPSRLQPLAENKHGQVDHMSYRAGAAVPHHITALLITQTQLRLRRGLLWSSTPSKLNRKISKECSLLTGTWQCWLLISLAVCRARAVVSILFPGCYGGVEMSADWYLINPPHTPSLRRRSRLLELQNDKLLICSAGQMGRLVFWRLRRGVRIRDLKSRPYVQMWSLRWGEGGRNIHLCHLWARLPDLDWYGQREPNC